MAVRCFQFGRSPRYISPAVKAFCSKAVIDRGVVLGVYENESRELGLAEDAFTDATKKFNARTSGRLREMIRLSGFEGKIGKSKAFFGIDKDYPCVVVVGLGKKNVDSDTEMKEEDQKSGNLRQASGVGVKVLRDCGVQIAEVDTCSNPQAVAEGAALALFSYDNLKSSKKLKVDLQLHEHIKESELRSKEEKSHLYTWHQLFQDGLLLSGAQNFARELMEMPSNLMTPRIFADRLTQRLSDLANVEVYARDQSWAEENKMGAFLSVGKGSTEPSVFLEMKYSGAKTKDSSPLVFVGKGVTFDSGGISIKPAAGMGLMKADMGGAATVSAAFEAIARLKLPINVTALTPLCENMPSGSANKPGDVVTAMNGKTIEIDNTDAEGRLILADALCYASNMKPLAIIDVATLTGAMDIALGQAATGVFTNSLTLWHHIFQAGFHCGERMWRMPLYQHYTEQIESDVADLRNTGKKSRSAGACTAAAFLKEFVDLKHWAHFDIAGVMDNTANAVPYLNKGMSGRPTRALVEIARRLSANKLD
ncbi:cytosol aminopeptidase-like isoform X1 [Porites lutea]|uniref:cytosol aminopeptidase-like isoform X1 n=1 Tax=Porites lutea TaxID=51062 RepID=UPI003CC663ED